jgi:hypothetical protein
LSQDKKFTDVECIYTDLNVIDESTGNIYLNSLETQKEVLLKVIGENDNSEIILVCHSQGCVVASLLSTFNLAKVFFLAPPTENDIEKSIERFKKKFGTIIDVEGESVLIRSDNSKTIVPKEYWETRKNLIYLEIYKNFSEKIGKEKLEIIIAKDDEVVANENIESLKKIGNVEIINGNHNFDGEREVLSEIIKSKI